MPTAYERARTATTNGRGMFVGGTTAVGAGLALPTAAGTVAGMLSSTAAAATITAGAAFAAPLMLAGGILVAGGTVAWGAYRVFWPRDREDFHNKQIGLADLEYKYWSCHIQRVGVVGIRRSGKTEIKAKLRGEKSGERNTAHIETHMLHVDNDKSTYVALIDGRGAEAGERDQQFEIADRANVLVIVIDHNISDATETADAIRLGEHEEFLVQLRERFARKADRKDRLRTIFAFNKKDLWSSDPARVWQLGQWFRGQVQDWRLSGISVGEATLVMSARDAADIDLLNREIVKAAKLIGPPDGERGAE